MGNYEQSSLEAPRGQTSRTTTTTTTTTTTAVVKH